MPKSPKPSQNKTAHPKISHVRIIAGEYRRRLVSFIEADGLRPTPDRLRETLFNWLNDDLPNARVLDCCAGSGILGFEALSRGASHVTLIEPNRQQFAQIQTTITQLKIEPKKITTIQATAQQAITLQTQVFDVIFLDPPYGLNLWQDLLRLLVENRLIYSETIIYIEADKPHEQLGMENLEKIKDTRVGQIYAGLYRVKS